MILIPLAPGNEPTYNVLFVQDRVRVRGGFSMRVLAICMVVLSQFVLVFTALAQQAADANASTAYCDFDDGQEISVRYNNAPVSSKDEPRNGKVWLLGGAPATFFTASAVTLNGTTIPAGAYSVYAIPNKKDWTLIVNKNITSSATYDDKQDVARSPMELGEVDSPPKQLQVSFAHVGPKQCSIRLYYGKVGAFAEFLEK
jgi:hypothetical protein